MTNDTLNNSKKAKRDEFYTRYADIENEVSKYKGCFVGKIVYCNCDDYEKSQFVKYLKNNFFNLGLKKLIATWQDGKYEYDGSCEKITALTDGSFSSAECREILKECDIVVANPPFSKFKDFFTQLIEFKKDFLIIASFLCAQYTYVFPHIKSGRVRFGYTPERGGLTFDVPYEEKEMKVLVKWFTTLPVDKKIGAIPLTKKLSEVSVKRYVNTHVIGIDRIKDIPYDYDGIMAVPISFFNVWCPEQFEIIACEGHAEVRELCGVSANISEEERKKLVKEFPRFRRNYLVRRENGKLKRDFVKIFIRKI